jgi:hypothetical protein
MPEVQTTFRGVRDNSRLQGGSLAVGTRLAFRHLRAPRP